ncbi:MAG: metal-binding protein [Betaproteobacteria bacterium]|nr:metal-binding protein [Betaproteobacteria bacterium]
MADSIAGAVIDYLEFARSGGMLERNVRLDELPRLADLLASTEGFLSVRLEGSRDDKGKSWLQVDIAGEPVLHCQRCLGGVEFPLAISSRLQLIAPGEEWPDDDLADDSADAIEAEKALAVLSLVEEEVLLALPIAPRHEQCNLPSGNATENGPSPFAALAALKKQRNKE